MDLKKLANIETGGKAPKAPSRVADSAKSKETLKRIKDARVKKLKQRIKDSVEDTETTEAVIEAILPFVETEDPAVLEAVEAIVYVFADIVEGLEEALEEAAGTEDEEESSEEE